MNRINMSLRFEEDKEEVFELDSIQGDIFLIENEAHILAECEAERFALISLGDGTRWEEMCDNRAFGSMQEYIEEMGDNGYFTIVHIGKCSINVNGKTLSEDGDLC